MKSYSQDLRDRVIAAIEAEEGTRAEIAERFSLARGTVNNWWWRHRDTGSAAALPHRSGPPRTLATCDGLLRTAIKKQPDASLEELCAQVQTKRQVRASRSMMSRTLRLLNLPRKKKLSRIVNGRRRA